LFPLRAGTLRMNMPAEIHHQPRDGNRVLLVEDSRAIASLLVNQFEQVPELACSHVATLGDARELLAEVADEVFVAVLDLNLPDAPDGEIVEMVQAYGIPVIVLTSSVDDRKREFFLRRQVADYVTKNHLTGIGIVVRLVERMRANRNSQVLVVDDSAAQRAYVCSLLYNRGYQTLQAEDGREALQMLRNNPDISLVLTDYNMPNMDGLKMVQEMRRSRTSDELSIIGISGVHEKGVLARFLKSGANDFLTRPFETEELFCRIDQNLDMLRYVSEARDAANRDFLTQLYNRRYFFQRAAEMHVRASRGEIRLLIAMVDADHFKKINDTHGHQTGDDALVAMSRVLQSNTGSHGFPARFGGEEFVYVQALDEDQDPRECLDYLREQIAAIDLKGPEGQPVPLTVSIGATLNPAGSIDEMLSIADQGVYLAKEQGRNRVVLVGESRDLPQNSQLLRLEKRSSEDS